MYPYSNMFAANVDSSSQSAQQIDFYTNENRTFPAEKGTFVARVWLTMLRVHPILAA
jgi:hypothetical protein